MGVLLCLQKMADTGTTIDVSLNCSVPVVGNLSDSELSKITIIIVITFFTKKNVVNGRYDVSNSFVFKAPKVTTATRGIDYPLAYQEI